MAKAVADVNGDHRQGGFSLTEAGVTGFSHMHDSGTGGGSSLGNFPLFIQAGCPGDELNRCKFNKKDRAVNYTAGTPTARPGYFSIELNTSVLAEMTTTNHTALYRFTLPDVPVPPFNLTGTSEPGPLSPMILADLTDLSDSRINGTASVDPATGRMTGSGQFLPTFGIGNYTLHFCADFRGASVRETGVFVNNRAGSEPKTINMVDDGRKSRRLSVSLNMSRPGHVVDPASEMHVLGALSRHLHSPLGQASGFSESSLKFSWRLVDDCLASTSHSPPVSLENCLTSRSTPPLQYRLSFPQIPGSG
jgi:hypothetical protein